MTAARHKMDDYAPYVYKTDRFRRDVAADRCGVAERRVLPRRSERIRTARVCCTSGPSWASTCRSTTAATGSRCSATFRSRPIYDFVVKDTDLVVATHGRSFWILDDLTPLHQMRRRPRSRPAGTCSSLATWCARRRTSRRRGAVRRAARTITSPAARTPRSTSKNCPPAMSASASSMPATISNGRPDHVLPRRGRGGRGKPDHPRRRRQGGRDVLQHDSRGEEGTAGLYITADAGMNSFQWPMTYPTGVKMVDTEFHTLTSKTNLNQEPGGPSQ